MRRRSSSRREFDGIVRDDETRRVVRMTVEADDDERRLALAELEAIAPACNTYGYLYWSPLIGRLTAVTLTVVAFLITKYMWSHADDGISGGEIYCRGQYLLFASLGIAAIAVRPPKIGIGVIEAFVIGTMFTYVLLFLELGCKWLYSGEIADHDTTLFYSIYAVLTPLLMAFICLWRGLSSEPLIPYGEQALFFSGRMTRQLRRMSGSPLLPALTFVVVIITLIVNLIPIPWAIFDIPKISLPHWPHF